MGGEQAAEAEVVDDAGALKVGPHGGQGPDVALLDGNVGTEVSRHDAQGSDAAAEEVGVPAAAAHVRGEVSDQAVCRRGECGRRAGVQTGPVPGRGREELQLGGIEEMLGQAACRLGPGAGAAALEGKAALERCGAALEASDGQAGGVGRDHVLPSYGVIADLLPRPVRIDLHRLCTADGATVSVFPLPDAQPCSAAAAAHVDERWAPHSPLRRGAAAALAHLEGTGQNLDHVEVDGRYLDYRKKDEAIDCFIGVAGFSCLPAGGRLQGPQKATVSARR